MFALDVDLDLELRVCPIPWRPSLAGGGGGQAATEQHPVGARCRRTAANPPLVALGVLRALHTLKVHVHELFAQLPDDTGSVSGGLCRFHLLHYTTGAQVLQQGDLRLHGLLGRQEEGLAISFSRQWKRLSGQLANGRLVCARLVFSQSREQLAQRQEEIVECMVPEWRRLHTLAKPRTSNGLRALGTHRHDLLEPLIIRLNENV
mmetsp:Transcript_7428/g.21100  ORF Transcript_7428/g.21100 Transcript_7428/m.21100 type:complete len:205 (+) Transcript_7428:1166-1780(+)